MASFGMAVVNSRSYKTQYPVGQLLCTVRGQLPTFLAASTKFLRSQNILSKDWASLENRLNRKCAVFQAALIQRQKEVIWQHSRPFLNGLEVRLFRKSHQDLRAKVASVLAK